MPNAEQILTSLQQIATQWQALALIWHLFFAVLILLLSRIRPSQRFFAILLTLPLFSVSLLAWSVGNPFNGSVLLITALALLKVALKLPHAQVQIASPGIVLLGAAFVAFGWVYPEFSPSAGLMDALYYAPTGLIPCPTLAIVIGFSIIVGSFDSRAWRWLLGGVGAFYALFGALYLGVAWDWMLLLGAVTILLINRVKTLQ